MRLCPHCGTQNSPTAVGCAYCGHELVGLDQTVPIAVQPTTEHHLGGTMVGIAPAARGTVGPAKPPPTPPLPPAPTADQFTRTQPLTDAPAPKPAGSAPPANRGLHRTMIGLAPPSAAELAAVPDRNPAFGGTLPTTQSSAAAARPRSPVGPSQPDTSPHRKTILGVARPGIAPLNPGQVKSSAPPVSPSLSATATASHPQLSGLASWEGSQPTPPETASKRGIPWVAAIPIIAAAGMLAAAAVVWLFYHGHGPIEARASALDDGSEQLELTCAACENGSVARLDGESATFRATHASLRLSRPLRVGENALSITIVSPRAKQSLVAITVPVAFRVRGDTSGLDAATPELRVLVSAVPGSRVAVDGQPLPLDSAGQARYALDVSALLTGIDPSVRTLERRVPYTVTPPRGGLQQGTVLFQTAITPLVIDAPGASVVVEGSNFVLAGHTGKGGALTVGDRPIAVDPSGRFAQMMNVSAPGETTILLRATSKESAPRLFPLNVRRVESLAREAARVREHATTSYPVVANEADSKGAKAVALDGSIVDAKTENYSTVMVMDVQSGCAQDPCLARITYGAPFSAARGDPISVFGTLDGAVDGPRTGTRIPQIHADFLLRTSK